MRDGHRARRTFIRDRSWPKAPLVMGRTPDVASRDAALYRPTRSAGKTSANRGKGCAQRQQDVRSWELPTAAVDRGCVKTRLHASNAQESSRPQVEMGNESARTAPAGFVSRLLPLRHDVFTQPRPIPAVRAPTAERPALTRSRLTQHGQMIDLLHPGTIVPDPDIAKGDVVSSSLRSPWS